MSKMNDEGKKLKFRPLVFFIGMFYILIFLGITTPLVLLYGPYENTKKTVVSTVLATRHSYLIKNFLSQSTIDDILGKSNEGNVNVSQDMSKVNIKYTTGNEINRINISTDRYDGFLLEIKNPLKVKVAMTKYLGKMGQKTSEMAADHDAVAAINGGAFVDVSSDGTEYAGTGAEPGGLVVSNGELIFPKKGLDENQVFNVVAFSKEGKLIVGNHSYAQLKELDVKEAMCFRPPNIIINGARQVKNKMEEGLNPRTAIGQKQDGTVLFLVIDGRKISTPGASLYDVQEILMSKGAINAGALDGGYSSTMYYKGEVINSPNAWDGERSVATAYYVED